MYHAFCFRQYHHISACGVLYIKLLLVVSRYRNSSVLCFLYMCCLTNPSERKGLTLEGFAGLDTKRSDPCRDRHMMACYPSTLPSNVLKSNETDVCLGLCACSMLDYNMAGAELEPGFTLQVQPQPQNCAPLLRKLRIRSRCSYLDNIFVVFSLLRAGEHIYLQRFLLRLLLGAGICNVVF